MTFIPHLLLQMDLNKLTMVECLEKPEKEDIEKHPDCVCVCFDGFFMCKCFDDLSPSF